MKMRLVLPDMIEKKHVHVASTFITGNADGEIIDTCEETYNDPSRDTISMGMHGTFVGFLPKTWLVSPEETK